MTDFRKGVAKTTPKGVLKFPFLQKASTKFKENGEYSCKIVMSPAEAAPLVKELDALWDENLQLEAAKAALNNKKVKSAGSKPWGPEIDPKNDEPTGYTVFKTKLPAKIQNKTTKQVYELRPKIFDAKGEPWTRTEWIGSGTVGKLNFKVMGYGVVKGETGLKLQLEAAQIINFVPAGKNRADEFGFDVEEVPEDDAPDSDAGDSGNTDNVPF